MDETTDVGSSAVSEDTNRMEDVPAGEPIPETRLYSEEVRLISELVEALKNVPDFRDKAAEAYARGSENLVFTHGGKDYRFSRASNIGMGLQIGELGAFEYGSGKGWEEEISIRPAWAGHEPTIEYGSKEVYRAPYKDKPEIHWPQHNTTVAVQNIEKVVQSLKPVAEQPVGQALPA